MNIIVFDDALRANFLPLAFTRPLGMFRMGLFTTAETWKQIFLAKVSCLAHPSLTALYPAEPSSDNLFINGRLLPSSAYRHLFENLKSGHGYSLRGELVVARCGNDLAQDWLESGVPPLGIKTVEITSDLLPKLFSSSGKDEKHAAPILLEQLPDLFTYNELKLREDLRLSTHGRVSAPIDPTCVVLGDPGLVFIESGAIVEACFLNTRKGPIYIGSEAQVMEGAVLHGPIAVMEHSVVRAGTRIYGATTVGPHCKVAGEVSNSVFFGYSNKAHDGFIGNSVIGSWCNLGADTNCSNLKNNYSEVSIWNYGAGDYAKTGLQFCGLIMGDHSKCGINTMFNTGTVVGVSANVFGGGFPPKFIPSFAWGGSNGLVPYDRDKAVETARRAMARRHLELSPHEEAVLRQLNDGVKVRD